VSNEGAPGNSLFMKDWEEKLNVFLRFNDRFDKKQTASPVVQRTL